MSLLYESWDAMFKMTDMQPELITDIGMFQFIEKVSYIANRYGKANNKYMKECDEKAPSKYIKNAMRKPPQNISCI